jgi:hypothetical protein
MLASLPASPAVAGGGSASTNQGGSCSASSSAADSPANGGFLSVIDANAAVSCSLGTGHPAALRAEIRIYRVLRGGFGQEVEVARYGPTTCSPSCSSHSVRGSHVLANDGGQYRVNSKLAADLFFTTGEHFVSPVFGGCTLQFHPVTGKAYDFDCEFDDYVTVPLPAP